MEAIQRDLHQQLMQWKDYPLRKPLILRGARQVGKSWLIGEFSKQFDYFIELNFEKDKHAHTLFPDSIDIIQIKNNIHYYSQIPIEPNRTLIFLDEIQECPNALRSLRYFKEEHPELHIVAAGSLLDFAIEKYGVPVGRVQFLYLYPLSFGEYLTAIGKHTLRHKMLDTALPVAIHQQLLDDVKNYSFIGGMPAAVLAWLEHQRLDYCQEAQNEILTTYTQDFEKYAKNNQIEHVNTLFHAIPQCLGNKFIYSNTAPELSLYQSKQALQLLAKAGIIHSCYHTSAQGIPLTATRNTKKFKVYFFDIGLAQNILGLTAKEWLLQPTLPQYNGAIAEQFVAQEIIAYSTQTRPAELHYWHREARSSNAEIDFVISKEGSILPIEVKSGNKGAMKSMQLFLESHPHSTHGIKVSAHPYSYAENIQHIPFYGLTSWLNTEIAKN